MAGIKGRSGRRVESCLDKRQKVIDLAWEIMEEAMTDKSLTMLQRAELAKGIAIKNIPQDVGLTGKLVFELADRLEEARNRINASIN